MTSMRRGFTLVELMVVLAVAVILMAIAVPSFQGVAERQRVKGAAAELVANIEFAKTSAAQRQTYIALFFDSSASKTCYSVYEKSNLTTKCQCTSKVCGWGTTGLLWVDFPVSEGVTVKPAGSDKRLAFSPSRGLWTGSPNATSIDIVGQRGSKLRVMVNDAARVVVCSPDASVSGYARCT
jgi:type IV fimbrial biogenesis protein FimT